MTKFPTYEQIAKDVAEKALDEILYDGKSIREWMKIIINQEPCDDMERKIEKEYLFESLCEDLKKLQAENEKLRKALEQETKTGHWIADVDRWGDIATSVNGYRCSECGMFEADMDKFCPNCGAKMEE